MRVFLKKRQKQKTIFSFFRLIRTKKVKKKVCQIPPKAIFIIKLWKIKPYNSGIFFQVKFGTVVLKTKWSWHFWVEILVVFWNSRSQREGKKSENFHPLSVMGPKKNIYWTLGFRFFCFPFQKNNFKQHVLFLKRHCQPWKRVSHRRNKVTSKLRTDLLVTNRQGSAGEKEPKGCRKTSQRKNWHARGFGNTMKWRATFHLKKKKFLIQPGWFKKKKRRRGREKRDDKEFQKFIWENSRRSQNKISSEQKLKDLQAFVILKKKAAL